MSNRNNSKGVAIVGIFSVIILVLGTVFALGTAYMLSNRETTAPEDSLAARPIKTDRPEKTTRPTKTPKPGAGGSTTKPPKSETGTTANGWKYNGFRDVKVDVVNNPTNNEVIIEFSRSDFSNVASIYYNFTYSTNGNSHGVESTINPSSETLIETNTGFVIRKRVYLGVCSKDVCTPHTNMSDFELAVTTTRDGSKKTYEQLLTKASL